MSPLLTRISNWVAHPHMLICTDCRPSCSMPVSGYRRNDSPTICSLILHKSLELASPAGKSILGSVCTWLLSRNAPDWPVRDQYFKAVNPAHIPSIIGSSKARRIAELPCASDLGACWRSSGRSSPAAISSQLRPDIAEVDSPSFLLCSHDEISSGHMYVWRLCLISGRLSRCSIITQLATHSQD